MDLTEAEDIKKRWQEYTEELYKKDIHDPDNHNGVITHLLREREGGKPSYSGFSQQSVPLARVRKHTSLPSLHLHLHPEACLSLGLE